MTGTEPPTVLVTGATGYIAGHCVQRLLGQGYRVRGTVRSLSDPKKVAHLERMRARDGSPVELFQADLDADPGWQEAVSGCTHVLHVASPFPPNRPKNEDDVVRPAVEGTRRVLEACSAAGVERVVMTSSLAAIVAGHDGADPERVYTEEDWSVAERCDPYQKSKTLAERFAWEFVDRLPPEKRFELVVINPGFVLGPLLSPVGSTSTEVVRRLLTRELPGLARLGWAVVDVRDVAEAHLRALDRAAAAGRRYVCAGEHCWMADMARILREELPREAARVPTRSIPYFVLWIAGRFDPTIRLALDFYGRKELVAHDRIRRDLDWEPRPVRETLVDTARSMMEQGIVESPK